MNIRPLVGAAIAGGLIWASRQEGGVKGTFNRLKEAANDIKAGEDFSTAVKRIPRREPDLYDDAQMAGTAI
jgi:hypothetical protein